jgi:Beta-galactosidase, domain 2
VKASPSYLDVVPGALSTTIYTDTTDLAVTPLIGRSTASSFFVVRHADYTSRASTSYVLKLPISTGILTSPQLGGTLTLSGRDSKIHATDYDVGGIYTTGEIFAWKNFTGQKALVVYGGQDEHHGIAVSSKSTASVVEGSGVSTKSVNGAVVIGWDVSPTRRIVKVDDLLILLLGKSKIAVAFTQVGR